MSVMEEQERTRRSFTGEFKRDAVSMVVSDGRTIVDVAESLGVGDGTLGNWVRQARVDAGEKAGVAISGCWTGRPRSSRLRLPVRWRRYQHRRLTIGFDDNKLIQPKPS